MCISEEDGMLWTPWLFLLSKIDNAVPIFVEREREKGSYHADNKLIRAAQSKKMASKLCSELCSELCSNYVQSLCSKINLFVVFL